MEVISLIQWVYDKPYKGIFNKLFHRLKFYRYINKELKNIAPDLAMLWAIAEFLRLIRIVYFYAPDTTKDHIVYYNPRISEYSTGFIIMHNKTEIKFILRLASPNITIEIRNKEDYKTIISKIAFDDCKAVIRDKTDEELFNVLNNLIMNHTISLLKEYYNKKH